jgi:ATP-dependent RNA helicase DeaD
MTDLEGVVPALRAALTKRNYLGLTPVQQAVLAPDMSGRDLLVSAQTGSGKTVAFGLAIAPDLLAKADRLDKAGSPLALIIAPTRELALQIKRELDWLYEQTGAAIASCVGGMDMRSERRALEHGAHIVVGTPGRLRDHLQRGSLVMSGLEAVVLDEADEMLDLGFRDDLEFILGTTPDGRRTLLFSATVPRSIMNLAKTYQRNAARISTSEERQQHVDIEYRALTVAPHERENAIVNVLRYYEAKNALVFCGTRATVNHMTARFRNRGFSVVALSGELSQTERSHALQAMRDGRARVCIATDVAARGIDLPNLELVVHADLPTNGEVLVHRSGRTGRAGRKGVSALIVPHNKRRTVERLLYGAKINASWAAPPSIAEITDRDNARLLEHAFLGEPVQQQEAGIVRELLARHGAEVVAAAFARAMRADKSAPEELLGVAPSEPQRQQHYAPEPRFKAHHDTFGDCVWFSLSVGRKQNAEPRWILPAICRGGNLTKEDVGAIKVQAETTFVQLRSACVDQFLAGIGPNKTINKTIRVRRLESPPGSTNEEKEASQHRPHRAVPRSGEHRGATARSEHDKPDRKPRPGGNPGMPYAGKPKKNKPRHAQAPRQSSS